MQSLLPGLNALSKIKEICNKIRTNVETGLNVRISMIFIVLSLAVVRMLYLSIKMINDLEYLVKFEH